MTTKNWQLQCAELKQRGAYLYKSKVWADCVFQLSSNSETEITIKAHKLILAMASPVFGRMFYKYRVTNPVLIKDVRPEVFKILLEYMYSDNLNLRTSKDACDLYYTAKQWRIPYVAEQCIKYLLENLTEDVCQVYELACEIHEQALQDACLNIFSTKTKHVLNDSSFYKAKLSTVLKIFSLEELNIGDELDLYEAAVRYANAQDAVVSGTTENKLKRRPSASGEKESSFDGPSSMKRQRGDVCAMETPTQDVSLYEHDYTFPDYESVSSYNQDNRDTDSDSTTSMRSNNQNSTNVNESNNNRIVKLPIQNVERNDEEKLKYRCLVEKIRFLTLMPHEFAYCSFLSSLLTQSEILAVIMNISSKETVVNMPEGFSTSMVPRTQATKDVRARLKAMMRSSIQDFKNLRKYESIPFYVRNSAWTVLMTRIEDDDFLFVLVTCFLENGDPRWLNNAQIKFKFFKHTYNNSLPPNIYGKVLIPVGSPTSTYQTWYTTFCWKDIADKKNGFIDNYGCVIYRVCVDTGPLSDSHTQNHSYVTETSLLPKATSDGGLSFATNIGDHTDNNNDSCKLIYPSQSAETKKQSSEALKTPTTSLPNLPVNTAAGVQSSNYVSVKSLCPTPLVHGLEENSATSRPFSVVSSSSQSHTSSYATHSNPSRTLLSQSTTASVLPTKQSAPAAALTNKPLVTDTSVTIKSHLSSATTTAQANPDSYLSSTTITATATLKSPSITTAIMDTPKSHYAATTSTVTPKTHSATTTISNISKLHSIPITDTPRSHYAATPTTVTPKSQSVAKTTIATPKSHLAATTNTVFPKSQVAKNLSMPNSPQSLVSTTVPSHLYATSTTALLNSCQSTAIATKYSTSNASPLSKECSLLTSTKSLTSSHSNTVLPITTRTKTISAANCTSSIYTTRPMLKSVVTTALMELITTPIMTTQPSQSASICTSSSETQVLSTKNITHTQADTTQPFNTLHLAPPPETSSSTGASTECTSVITNSLMSCRVSNINTPGMSTGDIPDNSESSSELLPSPPKRPRVVSPEHPEPLPTSVVSPETSRILLTMSSIANATSLLSPIKTTSDENSKSPVRNNINYTKDLLKVTTSEDSKSTQTASSPNISPLENTNSPLQRSSASDSGKCSSNTTSLETYPLAVPCSYSEHSLSKTISLESSKPFTLDNPLIKPLKVTSETLKFLEEEIVSPKTASVDEGEKTNTSSSKTSLSSPNSGKVPSITASKSPDTSSSPLKSPNEVKSTIELSDDSQSQNSSNLSKSLSSKETISSSSSQSPVTCTPPYSSPPRVAPPVRNLKRSLQSSGDSEMSSSTVPPLSNSSSPTDHRLPSVISGVSPLDVNADSNSNVLFGPPTLKQIAIIMVRDMLRLSSLDD